MFKQNVVLNNFFDDYKYSENKIGFILKHFLKGEVVVKIPNSYEELLKIKSVESIVTITGDTGKAEVEYTKNPNYSENVYSSVSGHNLIHVYEDAMDDVSLKRIIRISNKDRSGESTIKIVEYGDNNDLYFTTITLNEQADYRNSIGSLKTYYYNSDTFNCFRGQETNFEIFSNLDKVGIESDDREVAHYIKQGDDKTVLKINLVLDKYDETINLIAQRTISRSMKRDSHV